MFILVICLAMHNFSDVFDDPMIVLKWPYGDIAIRRTGKEQRNQLVADPRPPWDIFERLQRK